MAITGKYKTPRREERYPVRFPLTLKTGGKSVTLYSSNVSFRGIFLCTDAPPVLRQLISIEAVLPPDESSFRSHGMSVFVLRPGEDPNLLPGVGVQFYAQGESERRKWERFVNYVRQNPLSLPPEAIDPVKRRYPRFDARFEVHLRDLGDLEVLYSKDISAGGMFLETDLQIDTGQTLPLTIFHPLTRHTFNVDSVVKRRSTLPTKGLGVQFVNLDSLQLGKLQEFVKDGLALLEEVEQLQVDDDEDDDVEFEVDSDS